MSFTDRQAFREWLDINGAESDGVWLLFGKKGKIVTLSAGDALEEAIHNYREVLDFLQPLFRDRNPITIRFILRHYPFPPL